MVHESVVADELLSLRGSLNREADRSGRLQLGFLPFFLKVTSQTLKQFPRFNATFDPQSDELSLHRGIHIGFAVDTEDGLVVPVVRDADTLSLFELQEVATALIERAKNRSIQLDEIRGGTFTITSYGSIGGLHSRPLILPPQVAILGIGRVHQEPVVRDEEVVSAQVLPLSLAFDHRVSDGAYAARFLNRLMELILDPRSLLTGGENGESTPFSWV